MFYVQIHSVGVNNHRKVQTVQVKIVVYQLLEEKSETSMHLFCNLCFSEIKYDHLL